MYEANRLGFHIVGCDINPMAHWIAQQSLAKLDLEAFSAAATSVISDVENEVHALYKTKCKCCGGNADVKYFLWVKTAECPHCSTVNDLFPGYRLAESVRQPRHVFACSNCGALNEYSTQPTRACPERCFECGHPVYIEGNVVRKKLNCRTCAKPFSIASFEHPPEHRMWAIEYRCPRCYKMLAGLQYKRPDQEDLANVVEAQQE